MSNSTREPGVIDRVQYSEEDHGILTFWLYIAFGNGGSGQRFGGICLSPETGADLKRALSTFFGKPFDSLAGTKCYALRSFGFLNDPIIGLENEHGQRFTLYRWAKKHWPDTLSPLAKRVESLQREIRFLRRRIAEEESELERVSTEYVDWEVP